MFMQCAKDIQSIELKIFLGSGFSPGEERDRFDLAIDELFAVLPSTRCQQISHMLLEMTLQKKEQLIHQIKCLLSKNEDQRVSKLLLQALCLVIAGYPFLYDVIPDNLLHGKEATYDSPTRRLNQETHFIRYMKNRVCRQIGLEHQIKPDLESIDKLPYKLLTMKTSHMLSHLSRHLSPVGAAKVIVQKSPSLFHNNKNIYSEMTKFIELQQDWSPQMKWSEYISYSEESLETKLSLLSAKILLKSFRLKR